MARGAVSDEDTLPLDHGRRVRISDGSYPLHPFLFAAASVLVLQADNLTVSPIEHAVPALTGALVFASIAYLAAAAIRRRLDMRAAVLASVWVAGCLFHAGLFGFMKRFDGSYAMVWSLPVALLAMTLLTVLAVRLSHPIVKTTHLVLTGIALALLISPAWQVGAYEWRNHAVRAVYDADRAAAVMPQIAGGGDGDRAAGGKRLPDIYHFVFDRYASEDILAHHYGLATPTIGQFLEKRGFHVVRSANSNYHRTAHSLASTFYMDYLDMLADDRVAGDDWRPVYAMLGDHRVARFLKARGYRFKQFGSWWAGTFHNPTADENRPHGFSEFNMLYLRHTILRPLFHALPNMPLTTRLDWDNGQCQRVAAQINEIKAIGRDESPLYVFAHILVPHEPYNFAPDGRCLSFGESMARGERQGYVDQIAYAGRIIEDLVSRLRADDREPPVILIQSDEGPFPDRDWSVPWQKASVEELRVKTGILSAYFFPDGDYSLLSDGITPVNSYRAVFNTYFGTDFPILPDRVFVSPDEGRLYEFHDVTSKVRGEDGWTFQPVGNAPASTRPPPEPYPSPD